MIVSRFTNSTYVKDRIGGIIGNVDDSAISSMILTCQDFYIGTILNYKNCGYYFDLMVKKDDGTLNAFETELIDSYIQPALAYWVYYELIDEISYRLSNKGLIKEGYEKGDPVSKDEYVLKSYKIKDKAIFYTDEMKKYLFCNGSNFPFHIFNNIDNSGINGGDDIELYLGRF